MRRLVFPAILACGLVVAGAVPAYAEPVPTETSAKAAAGKKVCKVTDPALHALFRAKRDEIARQVTALDLDARRGVLAHDHPPSEPGADGFLYLVGDRARHLPLGKPRRQARARA